MFQNGPGTLTLEGVEIYIGDTYIVSSTLTLSGQLGGGNYAGNLFDSGAFNYSSTSSQVLSGTISGTGTLTQNGPGTLTLSGTNTYNGNTTIGSGAILALTSSGSIYDTAFISINENATFDVSANSTFSLGNQTLSASGTASHATINGASGGTVSLGLQPIILTYDGLHPALSISQGTLILNGNTFTINTVSPLGLGAYILVRQANGNITNSGTLSVAGSAVGPDKTGSISVSGGSLILAIQNPTSTALSVSGSPTSYGGLLTFHATVSPAPVDGEIITFMDGTAVIGTGLTTGGVATLPINTLGAGSHSITALYPGDTSNAGSKSSLLSQTVSKATPTITSSPTAASITYGQTLAGSILSGGAASTAGSFAFTTPATAPIAGTANQNVTFTPSDTTDYNTAGTTASLTVSPATPIVTVTVGSYTYNGSAQGPDSLTTTTTDSGAVTWSYVGASYSGSSRPVSAGSYTATATVAADANNNSASSSATPFIINQQTNTIALISSANPSSLGQSVTYTANIQINGATKSDATSNVVFVVDTVPMATNVLAGGHALVHNQRRLRSVRTAFLPEYTGDNNYIASTNGITVSVTALPVTPIVTVTIGSYTYNGSAQGPDSVTISPMDSGAVTWSYVGAGGTSYSSSSLPVSAGSYTATATVAAENNISSASSGATPFIIHQQTNAIALTSSANPSSQGRFVTFTASILVNGVTMSDATSNVVFVVDTVPMATNVLVGGQAAYATSALAVGGHSILAEYTGDNNYTAGNNSPALMQTVTLSVATPQTLYVITDAGRLYQFNIAAGAASGTAVAGASGLDAQAMAVDRSGNLFIATLGDEITDFGDLYELATNGVLQTVTTGLNYPDCLAVDSHGNLFEGEADLAYLNEFVNTAGTLSSTPVPLWQRSG